MDLKKLAHCLFKCSNTETLKFNYIPNNISKVYQVFNRTGPVLSTPPPDLFNPAKNSPILPDKRQRKEKGRKLSRNTSHSLTKINSGFINCIYFQL